MMSFFRNIKENLVHNCKTTTIGTLCLVLGAVFIVDSQNETPRVGAEESLYAGIALLGLGLILVIYAAAKNNSLEEGDISFEAEGLVNSAEGHYQLLRGFVDWDEGSDTLPRVESF